MLPSPTSCLLILSSVVLTKYTVYCLNELSRSNSQGSSAAEWTHMFVNIFRQKRFKTSFFCVFFLPSLLISHSITMCRLSRTLNSYFLYNRPYKNMDKMSIKRQMKYKETHRRRRDKKTDILTYTQRDRKDGREYLYRRE